MVSASLKQDQYKVEGIKVGVVIPTLSNFLGALNLLTTLKSQFSLNIYMQPNWQTNNCVAKAWNNGIQQSMQDGCNFVLILNDDTLLHPECIDALVWEHINNDAIIITGCETQDLTQVPSIGKFGIHFSCFMTKINIFDCMGLFDENFRPAYFEDNDCVRRLKLLELDIYGITQALFWHEGSKTGSQMHRRAIAGNRTYYEHKWGGVPGAESYMNPYNEGGSPKLWRPAG